MRSPCSIVLWCCAAMMLAGCLPSKTTPEPPACIDGSAGCACGVESRCDGALVCDQGLCQPCTPDLPSCAPTCQPGLEGCACGPGETCSDGLTCHGGVCAAPSGCAPGLMGCMCSGGGQCDANSNCVDGVCQPCAAEGCAVTGCDEGSAECETRITCSTLPTTCSATETCIEHTATEDAYCAGQVCPSCSGPGVVGGAGIRLNSGICICQTQPGYYFSESGSRTAVPCDADGDGWVRSSARFYINHADSALRENARCSLRVVNQIILHNDLGQSHAVGLGRFLPLYESVRNDDSFLLQEANGPQLPSYGAERSLRAEELNSLTKACVGERADFNDNLVSDVAEWGRAPGQQSDLGTSSDLEGEMRAFFEVYTRFSYFLELHRGWFTPGVEGAPGSYHIQEKSRVLSSGTNFPLRYGIEPGGTVDQPILTSQYWQHCPRARDSWYSLESPPIGLDFAALSGPSSVWKGMLHHSQFKCVQVVDEARFATADRAANRHLQSLVSLGDPSDSQPLLGCDGQVNCACRLSADKCNAGLGCEASQHSVSGVCRLNRRDHLRATLNVCGVVGDPNPPASAGRPNPSDPTVSCSAELPHSSHLGRVMWAAVRLAESSQYSRGCILQCEGHPFLCSGANSDGCYSICGDFASSESRALHGAPSLRLRGEVPSRAYTSETLSGQRFNIHPR